MASDTYTRQDLSLEVQQELDVQETSVFRSRGGEQKVRSRGREKKMLVSLIFAALSATPLFVADVHFSVCADNNNRQTSVSMASLQPEIEAPAVPPKLSLAEAIQLADLNYQQVEDLLEAEVER
ncbi:MAG: hypothetical protein KAI47_18665, partial [Deltaproteobacteria bacterium]|nr:hypothetical protein [Deltaproteobacteria bacterium]